MLIEIRICDICKRYGDLRHAKVRYIGKEDFYYGLPGVEYDACTEHIRDFKKNGITIVKTYQNHGDVIDKIFNSDPDGFSSYVRKKP